MRDFTPWLDLLCCPDCHGGLNARDGSLECRGCDSRWPVREGIPDFAPDLPAATSHGYEGLAGRLYAYYMDTPWLQGLDSWLFGLDNRHYRAWVAGRLAGIVRGPVVEVPIGGAPFLGTCPQYRELAWVGVDLSWTMLRRTQDKLLRTGADALLLRADAGHLPLRSGSMGAVVSLFGLHCFHDKPRVAKELRRSLALDGEVIISSLTLGTSALSDAYFHLLARDGTFDAGTTSARIKAVMTDAGFHGLRSECTGAALLLHGTVARQPALETSS